MSDNDAEPPNETVASPIVTAKEDTGVVGIVALESTEPFPSSKLITADDTDVTRYFPLESMRNFPLESLRKVAF